MFRHTTIVLVNCLLNGALTQIADIGHCAPFCVLKPIPKHTTIKIVICKVTRNLTQQLQFIVQ